MFGPLNGVRVALVVSAGAAALAAFSAGHTGAGMALLAGVAIHGLGWAYLASHRYPEQVESNRLAAKSEVVEDGPPDNTG